MKCDMMMKNCIKTILGTIIILQIIISTINIVSADGMIIPHSETDQIKKSYPDIIFHIVDVSIENQYVITHLDQEFFNPYNETLIGTYIFPVPEGAIISNLTVIIDGKEKPFEIMDKTEAEKLFQQSIIEMNDASLLQYLNNNLFSCEVSIPANSSIKMSIQYEEIITMNGGMYNYVYTLSTEQYSSKDIDNVSITVHINSDKNIDAVYCPIHTITSEKISPNEVYVYYEVKNARPDTDFELFFSVTNKDFGSSLLTFDEDDEDFFMFFFNSNGEQTQNGKIIPKDIVFVIDESGSMYGEKIIQARDALKWILEKLNDDDRFNIINFNSNSSNFMEGLADVNSNTIEKALNYVDGIIANGGTNINEALLMACDMFKTVEDRDSIRVIFFLTDGQATAGITDTEQIIENIRKANIESKIDASIFVFGVGYNVNTHLLDKLSNENHGSRVYVKPNEDIESKLIEIFSKIQNPLLKDISIEFKGIEVYDVYPKNISDLYDGSEIILIGKYKDPNNKATVYVNASRGESDVEFTYEFDIKNNDKNSFIPRIWATRRIGFLMDQIKLGVESDDLIDEIRELGLKYGIVTPYTSLIIHEQYEGLTVGMSANQNDSDKDGVIDAWQISGERSNAQSEANYAYQQSNHAQSTTGANIQTNGNKIFAEINGTQMDLELLGNITKIELGKKSVKDWVNENLMVNNYITFGSDEYFELLKDEELANILSAGTEVVFQKGDESYYISHDNPAPSGDIDPLPEVENNVDIPGFQLILCLAGIGILFLLKRK